jgi:hypothetical protein
MNFSKKINKKNVTNVLILKFYCKSTSRQANIIKKIKKIIFSRRFFKIIFFILIIEILIELIN